MARSTRAAAPALSIDSATRPVAARMAISTARALTDWVPAFSATGMPSIPLSFPAAKPPLARSPPVLRPEGVAGPRGPLSGPGGAPGQLNRDVGRKTGRAVANALQGLGARGVDSPDSLFDLAFEADYRLFCLKRQNRGVLLLRFR